MAAAGRFRPIRPFSSSVFERGTRSISEDASQTFKVGAPLIFNGAYLQEAGAAPATVSFIAAEDAHNNSVAGAANILVYEVMDNDYWECSLDNAYALTHRGDAFGLVKDATTGYWYADIDDANDQVLIIDVDQTPELGAVGDTKARAIVKFQTANIANF